MNLWFAPNQLYTAPQILLGPITSAACQRDTDELYQIYGYDHFQQLHMQ